MHFTRKDERGQTMTEYILIIALIAIFVIGAVKLFGKKTSEGFQEAAGQVDKAVEYGTKGAAGK